MTADSEGNLYILDSFNHLIRKVSTDGTVTTIAGVGARGHRDGKAEEAKFGLCFGIAVGEDGTIFFSDFSFHVVRKISGGLVTTLAGKPKTKGFVDGKGEEARFENPHGVCVDSDGSLLVVKSSPFKKQTPLGFSILKVTTFPPVIFLTPTPGSET